jgi:hypothetical protein
VPQKPLKKEVTRVKRKEKPEFIHVSRIKNKASGEVFLIDQDTSLRDFYYYYKPDTTVAEEPKTINVYENITPVNEDEFKAYEGNYYYELHLKNKGGLVMPVIIQWNYEDGSSEVDKISAYIWRKDEHKVVKTFAKNKKVSSIVLDPFKETADIDEANNTWPSIETSSRIELFKAKAAVRGQSTEDNPMKKKK